MSVIAIWIARLFFAGDAAILDKGNEARKTTGAIEHIFSFDKLEGARHWNELIELGRTGNRALLEKYKAAVKGSDLASIRADEPAARAMRLLQTAGHDRLAVIGDGRLTGILTRNDVRRGIAIRTALET